MPVGLECKVGRPGSDIPLHIDQMPGLYKRVTYMQQSDGNSPKINTYQQAAPHRRTGVSSC